MGALQRGQCQRSRLWRGLQRKRLAALSGEQCARQGQQLFAEAVRQQAVVADAHETPGQNVEEETAQELHSVEGHDTLLAAVGIIAPAEADVVAVEGGEAVVADGHAVGVTAEIAQDMFGAAEGRLGIDEPELRSPASSSVVRTTQDH